MIGALAALALVLSRVPSFQEPPMIQHARGTFEVSVTPAPPADDAAPDSPGRMILAKIFNGEILATGEGEMLATMGPDQSGAYVALERVRGAINGRTGTFALVHRGIMDRAEQALSITVVPGSGTGELAGISGVFYLTIADGEHRYDLEYTLPSE